MEMELIHRQEELEHAELERALMLSLAAEEERIRALVSDMKLTPDENTPVAASDAKHSAPAESKGSSVSAAPVTSKAVVVEEDDDAVQSTQTSAAESTSISTAAESKSTTRSSPKKMKPVQPSAAFANLSADAFADVKPLKMREMKPLPLPSLNKQPPPEQLVQDLLDKKKLTESIVKKGAEQLQSQRANEESMKQQLVDKAAIDKEELERRAKHLQAQRDLLIAKKKAEREEKVRVEEERKRKVSSGETDNESKGTPGKKKNPFLDAKGGEEEEDNSEEIAEMRRATMRMALARRLKLDLIESEEAKMNALQETQFLELDKKLQQVEQLREDNRKREYILQRQLERQQEQIARNMEISAAQMARNRDL